MRTICARRNNPCREIIEGKLQAVPAPIAPYAPFVCVPAPAEDDFVKQFTVAVAPAHATPKETAVEPVPEVGLPAYYVDPSLVILKNGQVLNIVAADRRQAVAVAAKALPRLQ